MRRLVAMLLVAVVPVLAVTGAWAHDREDDDGHHGDGHGGVLRVSPARDLMVPRSWAGQWRITTTHHRGHPPVVAATDDVTGAIRAGEPLGLSLLTRGGLASCTGRITDGRLTASCARRLSNGVCHVAALVRIDLERDRDALAGSGVTTTAIVGRCGDVASGHTRATFELRGTRLGRDRSDPRQPLPPLLTRFVLSVPLLTFLATAPQVTPVIADDCEDGAWRAFTSPAFRSEAQCLKVVRDRDDDDRDDHHRHGRHYGKDGRR